MRKSNYLECLTECLTECLSTLMEAGFDGRPRKHFEEYFSETRNSLHSLPYLSNITPNLTPITAINATLPAYNDASLKTPLREKL